ncbi:molecular chaperone DjiA [Rhizobiaceae bacterium]|nr:molecular chaperone DjiA [Rhizobiaceae bacterium]
MSIWQDIRGLLDPVLTAPGALARGTAQSLSAVLDRLRAALGGDPVRRRQVAFSIALIALSAKMAKADGVVSQSEVDAFREVFAVPDEEIANVARLYDLAKQDVAGFDGWTAKVRALFPGDGADDRAVLGDVLDALFHIAKADGVIHEDELTFLEEVAMRFGFDEPAFSRLRARHAMGHGESDPYVELEVMPDWSFERMRSQYRTLAAHNHPDRLVARGVPPEFVAIASDRLARLNDAWAVLEARHRPHADARRTREHAG